MDFSADEMMTSVAARELADGDVVFVGIGLPNLRRVRDLPRVKAKRLEAELAVGHLPVGRVRVVLPLFGC